MRSPPIPKNIAKEMHQLRERLEKLPLEAQARLIAQMDAELNYQEGLAHGKQAAAAEADLTQHAVHAGSRYEPEVLCSECAHGCNNNTIARGSAQCASLRRATPRVHPAPAGKAACFRCGALAMWHNNSGDDPRDYCNHCAPIGHLKGWMYCEAGFDDNDLDSRITPSARVACTDQMRAERDATLVRATAAEQRQRITYDSTEFPQGQFLLHYLDTGYTAIQWWDRCQGDTRGACNSTVLLEGRHTAHEMLAALVKHLPHVLDNLTKAGIALVEVKTRANDMTTKKSAFKLYAVAVDDRTGTMTLSHKPPTAEQLKHLEARERRLAARSKKALRGRRPAVFRTPRSSR